MRIAVATLIALTSIFLYLNYRGVIFYYGFKSAIEIISLYEKHYGGENHLSPQASALNRIFKLFPLKPKNIEELREQLVFTVHPPLSLSYNQTLIKSLKNSILVEHINAPHINKRIGILYIHGGGLVGGSPKQGFAFLQNFPEHVDMLCVRYAFAPEHLIDEALADVYQAYKFMANRNYNRLVIMGDSAGGLLSTLTVMENLQHEISIPNSKIDSMVLMSPWLDVTCASTKSFEGNAHLDFVVTEDLKRIVNESLTEALSRRFATAEDRLEMMIKYSPYHKFVVNKEKIKFPRVYQVFSKTERFSDENVEFFEELQRQTPKEYRYKNKQRCIANLPHVYPLFGLYVPEAAEAIKEMTQFVLSEEE
ncbi:monoterpene epsilon-lactone hydrolase [Acrasis kona]|uniref:Monoterpene epsilon-lactone hydrolase n=1 Tax=Acrasis kona TaxID=1008807 RepID=A0AAW2Z7V4_9EUKA